MQLPKAEDLKAVLLAAREAGVSKLRLAVETAPGTERPVLEADFSPYTQADLVAAINQGAPLPAVSEPGKPAGLPDMLETLANGGRLVDVGSADPTAAS